MKEFDGYVIFIWWIKPYLLNHKKTSFRSCIAFGFVLLNVETYPNSSLLKSLTINLEIFWLWNFIEW